MALGDPPGSVSDVLEARRALAAVIKAPRWVLVLAVAGAAAATAALAGGGLMWSGLVIAAMIALATISTHRRTDGGAIRFHSPRRRPRLDLADIRRTREVSPALGRPARGDRLDS
jgi:hypothetical protein